MAAVHLPQASVPVCRCRHSRASNGKFDRAAAAMEALRGTLRDEHTCLMQVCPDRVFALNPALNPKP